MKHILIKNSRIGNLCTESKKMVLLIVPMEDTGIVTEGIKYAEHLLFQKGALKDNCWYIKG